MKRTSQRQVVRVGQGPHKSLHRPPVDGESTTKYWRVFRLSARTGDGGSDHRISRQGLEIYPDNELSNGSSCSRVSRNTPNAGSSSQRGLGKTARRKGDETRGKSAVEKERELSEVGGKRWGDGRRGKIVERWGWGESYLDSSGLEVDGADA